MALASFRKVDQESSLGSPATLAQLTEVYTEMLGLLEDYAPVWYTEELRRHAIAGLVALQRLEETSKAARGSGS